MDETKNKKWHTDGDEGPQWVEISQEAYEGLAVVVTSYVGQLHEVCGHGQGAALGKVHGR